MKRLLTVFKLTDLTVLFVDLLTDFLGRHVVHHRFGDISNSTGGRVASGSDEETL